MGWPGAAATQAATRPAGGARFGPPTAAAPLRSICTTRKVSQSGCGAQSASV